MSEKNSNSDQSPNELFQKFFEESKNNIEELRSEYQEIEGLHTDLFTKPHSQSKSKAEKLSDTIDEINKFQEELNSLKKELDEYDTKIFGKDEKDTKSFNNQIEILKTELKDLYDSWDENYETLSTKIEQLLPGATAAGLAKSYHDQKVSYQFPSIIWSIVFSLTMVGMVIYAVFTLTESSDLTDATINLLSRAPFFIPTIWLAYYSSKQQSQYKRLQEEYAFKESLAKSYEGYKREIDKLENSTKKTEISENLLDAMVQAASYNPSITLEKESHNDSHPLFGNFFRKNRLSDNKTEK